MMTRSGNYYGEILEDWKKKANEILKEFDKVHRTFKYVMRTEIEICADTLEHILLFQDENSTWFTAIADCLNEMETLLEKEDPEWTEEISDKISDLIEEMGVQ
jgi:ribosome assembly protein YihI (activator of Der GTPase)